MYGYNIFLTSGQTIEGEIEGVSEIAKLPGAASAKTPITITDTEGNVIINPKYVASVSYWEIKSKSSVGFDA